MPTDDTLRNANDPVHHPPQWPAAPAEPAPQPIGAAPFDEFSTDYLRRSLDALRAAVPFDSTFLATVAALLRAYLAHVIRQREAAGSHPADIAWVDPHAERDEETRQAKIAAEAEAAGQPPSPAGAGPLTPFGEQQAQQRWTPPPPPPLPERPPRPIV